MDEPYSCGWFIICDWMSQVLLDVTVVICWFVRCDWISQLQLNVTVGVDCQASLDVTGVSGCYSCDWFVKGVTRCHTCD